MRETSILQQTCGHEWIETANEIVRAKFEESYAVPVEQDDGEGLPAICANMKKVCNNQPYHQKLN
jgi:hypothetical protein